MTEENQEEKERIEQEEKVRAEAKHKAEEDLKEKKKKEEGKKVGQGCLVLVAIVIVIVVIISISSNGEKPELTEEEQRTEMIEEEFNPWDGSHYELTKVIKDSMHDPGSYEHVETVYGDRGDYLIVETTFRGKNVYGGVVTNIMRAKVSLDGEVLEILSQE